MHTNWFVWTTYTHDQTPTHNKICDPLAFGAITVHRLPTPSLIFIFLYHHITLILLYLLHTRLPTKPPDPLIPRWVNCSSCPWPQPFVAIRPDFLRGPDLIWPYQSHYTAPFCSHHRALSPFRPRDCAGEHTARDLSSSQTSYYTAQQQWALFSDAPQVR